MDGGEVNDGPLFIQTEVKIPEFALGKDLNKNEIGNETFIISDLPNLEAEEEDPLISIIEDGLYQLGNTADGISQVYLNLILKAQSLVDVEFLKNYGHIQVLDVSENNLTDLNPVKHLPYLISLNASHNQLDHIINSNPPIGLREVNFAFNHIEDIGDLSCHPLLCTLLLDNNSLTEIKGIDRCSALTNFSASHNKLVKISGLEGLPIKQLDLSNNYIRKIENLQTLKHLQYINLGYNSIRSLRGLQDHELLEDINLRYNQVIDISEIRYLRGLKLLRILNLDGNPIQDIGDYRLSILFRIPALMELDVAPVSCEEKVAAVNMFKPSLELTTSADHMENLMKSYTRPTVLLNSTLPTTDPYPMLIIVGPLGLGKKALVQKIAEEFPNHFGISVGYTTRNPSTHLRFGKQKFEEDGLQYHFITKEEFEKMKGKGEFLQTCTLFGHLFGISRQLIEEIAGKNLACILTMELEGIMTLKQTRFKPRCILVIPENMAKYEDELHNSNRYTETEIYESVQKVSLYTEFNQIHPGYFDAVVMTDCFEDRCVQVKSVIHEYLDLTPPTSAVYSSGSNDSKVRSNQRLSRTEASLRASVYSRDCKLEKIDVHSSAPTVSDSYQRRYEKTKAALMGVTSSFQEQLEKIKTPTSSEPIPFVRGYEDLLKSCTLSPSTTSLISDTVEQGDSNIPDDVRLTSDARLTSILTTDTVLRYQDLDDTDLD